MNDEPKTDALDDLAAAFGRPKGYYKPASTGGGSVADAIRKGAADIGIDPVDYATGMLYETGGELHPWKAGPVSKWGQHRGTIQYGVPQQKEFGVHEGQSLYDQITDSNVRYLKKRGVKPGMGFAEFYKTINAGRPDAPDNTPEYMYKDGKKVPTGRTVGDNVRKAKEQYRSKALELLGESEKPLPGLFDLMKQTETGEIPGLFDLMEKQGDLPKADGLAQEVTKAGRLEPTNKEPVPMVKTDLSKKERQFSSTQIDMPDNYKKEILDAGKNIIRDEDIYEEEGREEDPHITVKFGLHGSDPSNLRQRLVGEKPFKVTLGKTSVFSDPDKPYDVVKVDVISPELHDLNKKVADAEKHTDTYPDYKPHLTLAYVKKGQGQKYADRADLEGKELMVNGITFSGKDHINTYLPFATDQQVEQPEAKPEAKQEMRTAATGVQILDPDVEVVEEKPKPTGGKPALGTVKVDPKDDDETKARKALKEVLIPRGYTEGDIGEWINRAKARLGEDPDALVRGDRNSEDFTVFADVAEQIDQIKAEKALEGRDLKEEAIQRQIAPPTEEEYRQMAYDQLMQERRSMATMSADRRFGGEITVVEPTPDEILARVEDLKTNELTAEEKRNALKFAESMNQYGTLGSMGAGLVGAGGRALHLAAGVIRPFSSIPGGDKIFRTISRQGTEMTTAEAMQGDGGIENQVAKLIGGVGIDLGTLAVLPGGPIAKFTFLGAGQAAGRGESMEGITKAGVHGIATGALFHGAEKAGNVVGKRFARLANPVKIGSIFAGSAAVNAVSDFSAEQNLHSTVINTLFEVFGRYGQPALGKIYRIWRQGKPVDVELAKNGDLSIAPANPKTEVTGGEIVVDPMSKYYRKEPLPDDVPVPETDTAIAAQTAAARNPQVTSRIAVLHTGENAKNAPKAEPTFIRLKMKKNGGILDVDKEGWKAKAKELGVKPTKAELVKYTGLDKDSAGTQELLGRVETVPDTSSGVAVEVTKDGQQIDAAVVTTPENAEKQTENYQEQYPDAATEVKPVEEAIANRQADLADENKPVSLLDADMVRLPGGSKKNGYKVEYIKDGKVIFTGTVKTKAEANQKVKDFQEAKKTYKQEDEPVVELIDDSTTNASGESSASLEAINRQQSEKAAGTQRVVVDTRSGNERPLIGPDAVDYKPQPYESVEFRGGDRDGEIIDQGAKAKPYQRKEIEEGVEELPKDAPEPQYESGQDVEFVVIDKNGKGSGHFTLQGRVVGVSRPLKGKPVYKIETIEGGVGPKNKAKGKKETHYVGELDVKKSLEPGHLDKAFEINGIKPTVSGKSPKALGTGSPVTVLPPRNESPMSVKIDAFKQRTGREPTESELFQLQMGTHPDQVSDVGHTGRLQKGDDITFKDGQGKEHRGKVLFDNDSLAQTKVQLYNKNGKLGEATRRIGHADITKWPEPKSPKTKKLGGVIEPEVLPPVDPTPVAASPKNVVEELPQMPTPDNAVNKVSLAHGKITRDIDPEVKRLSDEIADAESRIITAQDEIRIEQSNLEEAKAEHKKELAAIRADKTLKPEAKREALEEAKAKFEDTKNEIEDQIDIYKDEIKGHKADLKTSTRQLEKVQAGTNSISHAEAAAKADTGQVPPKRGKKVGDVFLKDDQNSAVEIGDTVYFKNGKDGTVVKINEDGTGSVLFEDGSFLDDVKLSNLYSKDPGQAGFASTDLLRPIHAVVDGVREMLRNPSKALIKAGVLPEATAHAYARISVPYTVKELLSQVFPEQFNDVAAMSRTMDIMNKDNILGGYDAFLQRVQDATRAGNAADAARWQQYADDIVAALADRGLTIGDLDRDVRSAPADVRANIDRWRQHVNPLLDGLFERVKGADPFTLREGRGRHFDARVNLLGIEHEARILDVLNTNQPQGASNAANYRNPNVKRDARDRMARFTGEYSTNAEAMLRAVLNPRWNDATKLDLIDALIRQGRGSYVLDNGNPPDTLAGEDAVYMPVKLPVTRANGHTDLVETPFWVAGNDLQRTLRQVLDTDMQANQNRFFNWLTTIQLYQAVDAVAHMKNIHTIFTYLPSTAGPMANAVKKVPIIGSMMTLKRIHDTHKILTDTDPQAQIRVRARLAEMARNGLIRPEHEHDWLQTKIGLGPMIMKADIAARVMADDIFTMLVEKNLVDNTATNRRQFIQQMGEYNGRMMTKTMNSFRRTGFAPFVVAGTTFNKMAVKMLTGSPGIPASSKAASAKLRALNLMNLPVAGITVALLNLGTTGMIGGRPGTPIGAWDLGELPIVGGTDEKGRHKVFDILSLLGYRRGMRLTGVNAVIAGLKDGKTADEIIGEAQDESLSSLFHPWMGPAPGFVVETVTGKKLDMRGGPDYSKARNMGGGGRQTAENFRVALQNLNALLYWGASNVGIVDKDPEKEGEYDDMTSSPVANKALEGLFSFIESLGKGPVQSIGFRKTKSPALKLIDEIHRNGTVYRPTAEQVEARAHASNLLRAAKQGGLTPELEAKLKDAVLTGALSVDQVSRLRENMTMKPIAVRFKYMSDDINDMIRVWQRMTDQERDDSRYVMLAKVARKIGRGELTDIDAANLQVFGITADSISALKDVAANRSQKELEKFSRTQDLRAGSHDALKGLKLKDALSLRKDVEFSQDQTAFETMQMPEKLLVFENTPDIGKQAEYAALLRHSFRNLSQKKAKTELETSFVQRANQLLNVYTQKKLQQSEEERQRLERIEAEATAVLSKRIGGPKLRLALPSLRLGGR